MVWGSKLVIVGFFFILTSYKAEKEKTRKKQEKKTAEPREKKGNERNKPRETRKKPAEPNHEKEKPKHEKEKRKEKERNKPREKNRRNRTSWAAREKKKKVAEPNQPNRARKKEKVAEGGTEPTEPRETKKKTGRTESRAVDRHEEPNVCSCSAPIRQVFLFCICIYKNQRTNKHLDLLGQLGVREFVTVRSTRRLMCFTFTMPAASMAPRSSGNWNRRVYTPREGPQSSGTGHCCARRSDGALEETTLMLSGGDCWAGWHIRIRSKLWCSFKFAQV